MILPKLNLKWKDISLKKKSPPKKPKEEEKTKASILKETIFPLIKIMVIYGLLLNYAAFVLFKMKFTFYSWPAYGIAYYFISEELTSFIRSMIPRR